MCSVIDRQFWAGQRVLVIGHTGFKGMGAEVIGLSLAPATDPSLYAVTGLVADTTSHIGSIVDRSLVDQVVAEADPTVVFHLAVQALARASYDDPADTFATNVVGTANVLDAARGASALRALVSVTSDKGYENQERD